MQPNKATTPRALKDVESHALYCVLTPAKILKKLSAVKGIDEGDHTFFSSTFILSKY